MRLSVAGSPSQTAALVRRMAQTVTSPGGGLQGDEGDGSKGEQLSRIRDYLKRGAPAGGVETQHLQQPQSQQARADGAQLPVCTLLFAAPT